MLFSCIQSTHPGGPHPPLHCTLPGYHLPPPSSHSISTLDINLHPIHPIDLPPISTLFFLFLLYLISFHPNQPTHTGLSSIPRDHPSRRCTLDSLASPFPRRAPLSLSTFAPLFPSSSSTQAAPTRALHPCAITSLFKRHTLPTRQPSRWQPRAPARRHCHLSLFVSLSVVATRRTSCRSGNAYHRGWHK